MRRVEAGWKRKRRHAVDCDLKAFFRYLKEQGVPELREIWIRLHYGDKPKFAGKAGESP